MIIANQLPCDPAPPAAGVIDLETLAQGGRVPVLPPGTTRLLSMLTDETLKFEDLAAVVGGFPTVAARLLAVANSPWSAPVAPIESLEMACARLGMETVRSISIAVTVSAPFNSLRCPVFDAKRYWCSALLVADTAPQIVQRLRSASPIEIPAARTAGLLHNLGLLWLADCLPIQTAQALVAVADNENLSVNQALRACCGFGHNEASIALARAWNLPPVLRAGMAYHDPKDGDPAALMMARVIAVAAGMVALLYHGAAVPAHPAFGRIDVDATALDAIYEQLRGNFNKRQKLAEALMPRRI